MRKLGIGRKMEKKKHIQLGDIAKELGLSKSTVSRAISGKGNISAATRERVKEFIELYGYQPNAAAQRLAEGRTGNIGVVLPADAFMRINSFFQMTLLGICREAASHDYDVVVTTAFGDSIGYLKRLVSRRSVDGVILLRSLMNDPSVKYLLDTGVNFVTIGSVHRKDVAQVDIPHTKACRQLTRGIIGMTDKPIGLIIGDENYTVNQSRKNGFLSAVRAAGRKDDVVFCNISGDEQLSVCLAALEKAGADTLVCGDDSLCISALGIIDSGKLGYKPSHIASFYDNPVLKSRGITAISVDDMSLGATAVISLLDGMSGASSVAGKIVPEYKINYRRLV